MKHTNYARLYKHLAVIKNTFRGKTEHIRHSTLTANQKTALREAAHYMRVWLDARGIPHPTQTQTTPKQLQDLAIPFANSRNVVKREKALIRECTRRAHDEAVEHYHRYGTGYESFFRERYRYWYQTLQEVAN